MRSPLQTCVWNSSFTMKLHNRASLWDVGLEEAKQVCAMYLHKPGFIAKAECRLQREAENDTLGRQ